MIRPAVLISALVLTSPAMAQSFNLSSPDVKAGAKIGEPYVFSGFGCSGGNQSPALNWSGAPKDTKSFAVTMYDPDAPTGSGWWHWLAFNLPATASGIPAGGPLPTGSVQSRTDFGQAGYGGPCPPKGDKPHHYIFTVYALKVPALTDLTPDSPGAMVGYYLNGNALAKASFTAVYGR